jgi:adenine phosphoribosyltransferase
MSDDLATRVRDALRSVPDFPKPGILFRDITPLLTASGLLPRVVTWLADHCTERRADRIACIESRGFLFGAPLAERLDLPLALIRKPGKLPHRTIRQDYALEYGSDALEMHADACKPGDRVVLIDDVLATGGTANAACELIEKLDAKIAAVLFVLELSELDGRTLLHDRPCLSLTEV